MHLSDLTQHILCNRCSSWSDASLMPVNWTGVFLSFLTASEDFIFSNYILEIVSSISLQCVI